jgi:hypothetical protein
VRDQREQPLGGGELPAPRDTKLAEQAREISRRQQRAERAEALIERQTQVATALGTTLTGELSRWRRSPWINPPNASVRSHAASSARPSHLPTRAPSRSLPSIGAQSSRL